MDGFLKRKPNSASQQSQEGSVKKPALSTTTNTVQSPPSKGNFLSDATALRVDADKDVGMDKLGEMKNNLGNVMEFFDLVKELDNIKGELQQLQFSEKFPKKEYRIIEMDKKIAEDFELGQRLVFRGSAEDYVVLCSENRSYAVKEVETSNSLLILPTFKMGTELPDNEEKHLVPRTVNAISHHYLELKEISCVSGYRLREMLHESEMQWDCVEDESKTYSFEELLDVIQMSEGQLRTLLDSMPTIEHNGKIRWLSHNYRDAFWSQLIDLCDDDMDAPDVNVKKVTFASLRARMSSNVTDSVIRWFLRSSCTPSETDPEAFSIDHRAILRARASNLLRSNTRIDTVSFEMQIERMLPQGIELDYAQLTGLCSSETNIKGTFLSYLNIEDLPEDSRERLKILFDRKETWTMDEVSPFLTDICSDAKSMNGLMVGHCRSTKDDKGQKVFCSLRAV